MIDTLVNQELRSMIIYIEELVWFFLGTFGTSFAHIIYWYACVGMLDAAAAATGRRECVACNARAVFTCVHARVCVGHQTPFPTYISRHLAPFVRFLRRPRGARKRRLRSRRVQLRVAPPGVW